MNYTNLILIRFNCIHFELTHMKKLLLSVFTLTLTYASFGQCTVALNVTDATLCQGDDATITATVPGASNNITTTFAAGNNHRGNMFDVVAINDITIDSVYAHPQANTTIEIYYKSGGFSGSENNAAAWTLVGSAAVTAQATGTPTPVPINIGVTIPAGQTYAFYVTSSDIAVSLNYTDGTSQGAVYVSDANMQVLQGVGLEYPFSGSPFSPRMWNGTIYYSTVSGVSYAWNTTEITPSITVSPTVTTTYSVDVTIPGCANTVTESIIVEVSDLTVDLGPDTTICDYNSITFDPGNDPTDTYQWSTTDMTPTLTIDNTIQSTGTVEYIVNVTDNFGCFGVDTVALTVDPCLSVFEKEKDQFSVYPNPASDEIYFSTNNSEAKELIIYDLTGAVVTKKALNENVKVSLSDYNNGMYIYKIFDDSRTLLNSGKFIVKK